MKDISEYLTGIFLLNFMANDPYLPLFITPDKEVIL